MKDEATILIQAHLDGELTDRQRRRLTAWLGKRANVERFVRSAVCTANCSICTAGRKTPRGARTGPTLRACRPWRPLGRRWDSPFVAPCVRSAHSCFILHPASFFYCRARVPLGLRRGGAFSGEPGCWRPRGGAAARGRGIRPRHRGARCGFYRAGRPVVRRPHHRGTSHCQWVGPNTTARQGEAVALGRKFALTRASWELPMRAGRGCWWPARPFTRWTPSTAGPFSSARSASRFRRKPPGEASPERRFMQSRSIQS